MFTGNDIALQVRETVERRPPWLDHSKPAPAVEPTEVTFLYNLARYRTVHGDNAGAALAGDVAVDIERPLTDAESAVVLALFPKAPAPETPEG